jgi:hypothetical protein
MDELLAELINNKSIKAKTTRQELLTSLRDKQDYSEKYKHRQYETLKIKRNLLYSSVFQVTIN